MRIGKYDADSGSAKVELDESRGCDLAGTVHAVQARDNSKRQQQKSEGRKRGASGQIGKIEETRNGRCVQYDVKRG